MFGSLQRELTQSASSLESFFSGSWWCHKVHAHGAASLQPPPLGFLMQMGLGLIGFGIDSVLQKPAVLLERGWWSGAQAGMRAGGFLLCQALLSQLPRAAKAERAALWPCHSPCGLFLEPLHPPYSRCKKKKPEKTGLVSLVLPCLVVEPWGFPEFCLGLAGVPLPCMTTLLPSPCSPSVSGATCSPKMLPRCPRVPGSCFSTRYPGRMAPTCSSSLTTPSSMTLRLSFMVQ